MSTIALPKTKALAGWYGANRMLAQSVGQELSGHAAVFVIFAGGMSELLYIKARTLVVSDLHRAQINLASVVGNRRTLPELHRRLKRTLFHPDELARAQEYCRQREKHFDSPDDLFSAGHTDPRFEGPDVEWAVNYFICCWMGRGGRSGTDGEFDGGISLRYDAGGGDSNTRFRSAVSSLMAWHHVVVNRCNFTCESCFDVLDRIKDDPENAIYSDAPWPDEGGSYRHKFTTDDQRRLARKLSTYKHARVVIRFGVCPLIEELYPRSAWTYREQTSRAQSNGDVRECLIINGESYASSEQKD